MKKMNRRDYLIRMRTGAGAVIGVTGLDIFGKEQPPHVKPSLSEVSFESQPSGNKPIAAPIKIWERRAVRFPLSTPDQIVKLIFYGLIGFSWREDADKKIVCDVGFHRKGDGYHEHKLSIYAYKNASSSRSCTPIEVPRDINKISFPKPETTFFDEAHFYQPGRVDRREQLTSIRDFRWIMDFESDYFYGAHLDRKKEVYMPTLSVPCGLFYTLHKTASTFRAQPPAGPHYSDLGSVADVLAANIYVRPGRSIKLVINDTDYYIDAPGEVYFLNHCHGGSACTPEPNNVQNKKERSDFYLNFEAFHLNSGDEEYELYLLHGHRPTRIVTVCKELTPRKLEERRLSDEAPCSGTGFGGGGGLPAYPPTV